MLLNKGTIVLVSLVLMAGIAAGSAGAVKADPARSTDGLIISSGYSMPHSMSVDAQWSTSPMATASAVYTIRQWQTNWHSKYISQGCPGYLIDLNWGNPANSLQLKVYGTDGRVYGPFYDGADGRTDGRIYLWVSQNGGLPGGNYYHEVYGYRVSGIEDYTF